MIQMTMFFSLTFLAQKYRVSWFVLGQCWDYMLASTLPAGASDPHWDSLGWIKTSASDFGQGFWHRPPRKTLWIEYQGMVLSSIHINTLIHRWWIIKIWWWSTESAPIHRPSILLEGTNNETWLTGKSPINEGFNGKIIYKISTVQYTSWFSIAVLV